MAQMATLTLRGQFRRIDAAKSVDHPARRRHANSSDICRMAGQERRRAARKARRQDYDGRQGRNGRRERRRRGRTRIPSATVLWTAGVAPSPLVKPLGGKTDKAGGCRSARSSWCQAPPACSSSAIALSQGKGPVPGVAQAAIQQGRYVGRLISRQLDGHPPNVRSDISIRAIWPSSAKIRDFGERAHSHERVRHLARLGLPASDVAAATAEPAQGAKAMALVLFHRATQLPIDPRTAKGIGAMSMAVDRGH